jgi:hypothetical protein
LECGSLLPLFIRYSYLPETAASCRTPRSDDLGAEALAKKLRSPIPLVSSLMEDYFKRGVFRSFSKQPIRNGIAGFRMAWHRDRIFDLFVDIQKRVIVIPEVLPALPRDLYQDFKTFVESHHEASLPDHRRTEKSKARLRSAYRRGSVGLTILVKDGDYGYALQRMIHLVQETYLLFLLDGKYKDYTVEQLGAEADIG